MESSWKEKQKAYFDNYGRKRKFISKWALYNEHKHYPVMYMDLQSDFNVGTILRTDPHESEHYLFKVTAAIGGTGTWGDVWSACDAIVRNARLAENGNLDKQHIHIVDFHKVSEAVYSVQLEKTSV